MKRKILLCLFILLSQVQAVPVKTSGISETLQKIKLSLLEAIAPQRHEGEGEIVTSNLGEILDDPKNETLKAVKVLGRKKRIQGESQKITQITWEEVALDAEPSPEMAARGVQVPVQNSLKEPVKKPLQSAFPQKAEVIQSGTPIEAKGDVEGLLAAARSLIIRAQKQGYKIQPVLGTSSSSFRGSSLSQPEASSPSKTSSSEERTENPERRSLSEDQFKGDKARANFQEKDDQQTTGAFGKAKTFKQTPFSGTGSTTERSERQGSFQSSYGGSTSDRSYPSFFSSSGSPYRGGMEFTSTQPWAKTRENKKKEDDKKDDKSSTPVVIHVTEGGDTSDASSRTRGRKPVFGDALFSNPEQELHRSSSQSRSASDEEEGVEARDRKRFSADDRSHEQRAEASRHKKKPSSKKGSYPKSFHEGSDYGASSTSKGKKKSKLSPDSSPENNDSSSEPSASTQEATGAGTGPEDGQGTFERTEARWRSRDAKFKGAKGQGYASGDEEGWVSEGEEGRFHYPFGEHHQRNAGKANQTPLIKVEYDFDSCSPRIDWPSKQVVLQAKAITFRGSKKIQESDCADTAKRFAIQKDYSCELCQDIVEKKDPPTKDNFGFAFSTYRSYWLAEGSQKTYLQEPQKDEKYPFALQEEQGRCTYKVDLNEKTATPQSELIYYNRSKQKVVVENCRPTLEAKSVAITATQKGCGIVHDFEKDRSIQQQRLLYTVDGVNHEVEPCRDVGDWISHEFDTVACKPFIDHSLKKQQPMARRFIITPEGKQYISECEIYGQNAELAIDYNICIEKPFHHDLSSKQSFRNGRYYYEHPSKGRKYVTPCHPLTDETFAHKKTLVGYEHNDQKRISKSKVEVSIEVDSRKVVVVPPHIDETVTEASYTKQKEKVESTAYQSKMTDRCYQEQRFRKHLIYQRIDGSEYLERADDKVQSIDRCKREKEIRYEQVFVTHLYYLPEDPDERRDYDTEGKPVNQLPWGGEGILTQLGCHEFSSHNMHHVFPGTGWLWRTDKEMERTKTIYPDSSTPEYSEWNWTGYYKDHSVRGCNSGGQGRPYPSVEGKRWHHSERKF